MNGEVKLFDVDSASWLQEPIEGMCSNYTKKWGTSSIEPKPTFFRDKDCKGDKYSLSSNINYLEHTAGKLGLSHGNNRMSSVLIPPNWRVGLYHDKAYAKGAWFYPWSCNEDGACSRFTGKSDTPGKIKDNEVSSIKVERIKSWNQHKLDCCLVGKGSRKADKSTTKNYCGDYWGPSMSGSCDEVVGGYCRDPKNADKDECSCFPKKLPANASKFERDIASAPECYSTKCKTRGWLNKTMLSKNCPDRTYCLSELKVSGNTNDMTNVTLAQDCSDKQTVYAPTSSAPPAPTPTPVPTTTTTTVTSPPVSSERSYSNVSERVTVVKDDDDEERKTRSLIILFILLILIIAAFGVYHVTKKNRSTRRSIQPQARYYPQFAQAAPAQVQYPHPAPVPAPAQYPAPVPGQVRYAPAFR